MRSKILNMRIMTCKFMDCDPIYLNIAHSCTTKAGTTVHTCMVTHLGAWGGAPMALVRQVLRPQKPGCAATQKRDLDRSCTHPPT